MEKKIILLLLATLIAAAVTPNILKALNMESDHFRIQWGNFNIASGKPTSSSYNLGITMGEIAPGRYSNANYTARIGFQYIHSIHPFRFTISDLDIDFGYISAQSPATDTNDLIVNCDNAGGYQVMAFEAHPLKSDTNYISDTTCDASDCDQTSAGVWTQNTTYGFGFNIQGDDVPGDFVDTTYFRQFADDSANEAAVVVMSNSGTVNNSTATVTYKVNTSPDQEGGSFETSVVYIATPTY